MTIHAGATLKDTQRIAKDFVDSLDSCDSEQACVFGLSGELGSGKTTFVQNVAKEIGITENVTSPTFVIIKFFKLEEGRSPFDQLIHIDAYRLEKASELEKLGWNELVRDKKNLILIEWPEKISPILPENTKIISFSVVGEGIRNITI